MKFETTTACTECGNLGTSWSLQINKGAEGPVATEVRHRNQIGRGLRITSCRVCDKDNRHNVREHVNQALAVIDKATKTTKPEELLESLITLTNQFNKDIRTYTEEHKNISGTKQIVTGTQGHRFTTTGKTGIECQECDKIFIVSEYEKNDFLICPHCAKEQQQIVTKEDLITL